MKHIFKEFPIKSFIWNFCGNKLFWVRDYSGSLLLNDTFQNSLLFSGKLSKTLPSILHKNTEQLQWLLYRSPHSPFHTLAPWGMHTYHRCQADVETAHVTFYFLHCWIIPSHALWLCGLIGYKTVLTLIWIQIVRYSIKLLGFSKFCSPSLLRLESYWVGELIKKPIKQITKMVMIGV